MLYSTMYTNVVTDITRRPRIQL